MPSALYDHLYSLASQHASGRDLFAIRHSSAIHKWGHAHALSQHPSLRHELTNEGLAAHFKSTGSLLISCPGKVHSIMVDEHQRLATIWMSYFLTTIAEEGKAEAHREVVENDLIWTLKFSGEPEERLEEIKIVESVEFIDPTASGRANELLRKAGIEIKADVVGGLGVVLPST
ncbi:uncharacterized protein B0I36DRAFT_365102 [Microdochium trichocladiopsis]|uniref:Uncharacterized protein n=1 Tax=Microdochium trichocladiopsis TaxID=1682393 RepID=A0A9P8Y3R9_9PEZI|nr:uncharacterized protein B0I36DRAFT_365102 [Microdochium trichocladiopsis]KAH7027974.1 hypothetical protein B0I36DRAFT_365102 [Microdochium trichocladiopsis]